LHCKQGTKAYRKEFLSEDRDWDKQKAFITVEREPRNIYVKKRSKIKIKEF
jgi:hypothetical protein